MHIYIYIKHITIFYMYVFAYVIDTSRTKVVAKAAGSGAGVERSGVFATPLGVQREGHKYLAMFS